MVTRPEKFLRRRVPPGSIWIVRVTCSVSSKSRGAASAGIASARTAKAAAMVRMVPWTGKALEGFGVQGSRFVRSGFRVQRARVNRHADDRVDAESVEVVDLFLRGDAAGGGDAAGRGAAHCEDRVDVRAAHQPLGVDV